MEEGGKGRGRWQGKGRVKGGSAEGQRKGKERWRGKEGGRGLSIWRTDPGNHI